MLGSLPPRTPVATHEAAEIKSILGWRGVGVGRKEEMTLLFKAVCCGRAGVCIL